MSAIGTKRTSPSALHMSAFGGKADIALFALQMSAYDPKRTLLAVWLRLAYCAWHKKIIPAVVE